MYSLHERNEIVQQLDSTRDELMTAIAGLSEAQSAFKPSPEAWSVANIVEHLAIVEDAVVLRLQQLGSAGAPDADGSKQSDAAILEKAIDRSVKFQAPERIQPVGRPLSNSLERFVNGRKKITDLVRTAPPDFRRYVVPHPVLGQLDGHQWLLAVAGHCARHTAQIIETKAATGFPKDSITDAQSSRTIGSTAADRRPSDGN